MYILLAHTRMCMYKTTYICLQSSYVYSHYTIVLGCHFRVFVVPGWQSMLRQWLHGPHHIRTLRARFGPPTWDGAVATRAELRDWTDGAVGKFQNPKWHHLIIGGFKPLMGEITHPIMIITLVLRWMLVLIVGGSLWSVVSWENPDIRASGSAKRSGN